MKKPSKQVVKKVLRQELSWFSSKDMRYLDSALLDGGVVVVTYLHRANDRSRSLRVAVADGKGDVRASYILDPNARNPRK